MAIRYGLSLIAFLSVGPRGQELFLITFGLFVICSFCLSIATILGSISMIRLQGRNTAITAAICSCIPCSLVCLGMPFGIWALILLLSQEARRDFNLDA